MSKNTKDMNLLSSKRRELYKKNAKIIKYYRENPVQACEDLLGIKLYDSQKYALENMWNTPNVNLTCCRAFGKSFLTMIFIMLKWMLYENQDIYIVSSVGAQAQEAFMKMEKIAKQQLASAPDLLDIFFGEVKKGNVGDGFSHDKTSFTVKNFAGSTIYTLNSKPDNNRSRRATLVFFDESAYCSEELIAAVTPFLILDSSTKLSTKKDFSMDAQRRQVPNQVVFASSAGDMDSTHYITYRDYAKRMIAGDSNYFVLDVNADIPLNPFLDGVPYAAQLTKEKIDADMRRNPEKARREYLNQFTRDGGVDQAVKWASIRRNETFDFPLMCNDTNVKKFALAIDPARSFDNSVFGAMEIKYSEEVGYYGEICNCMHFADLGKRKKTPMRTPEQIKLVRDYVLDYNGVGNPDYENIQALLIDSGAGGGGRSAWADNLLEDWCDKSGRSHKGFIDYKDDEYAQERSEFPNASRILNLVNPKKWKTIMGNELCELMELDLIKFPREYSGKQFMSYLVDKNDKESLLKERNLSTEEQIALTNIDIMKTETTSIHKFKDSNGVISRYALPKEKERKMHDDRFYVLLMLAHYLYELRRDSQLSRSRNRKKFDVSKAFMFKAPVLRKR